jgi:RNA polymerase sigma factor (sigma-70 family)
MEWAWAHRERLAGMDNPAGYLWRVGTSRSRRLLRWRREQGGLPTDVAASEHAGWFEPALPAALNRLGRDERVAVVLVHCFDWSYAEVAELLDVPLHTVRNRIHRGMASLRRELGVEHG